MSALVVHDCPHCPTRFAAFTIVAEADWKAQSAGKGSQRSVDVFARCPACSRGVIFEVTTNAQHRLAQYRGNILDGSILGTSKVVQTFPPAPQSDHPQHTPVRAAEFYKQGFNNIRTGHWDAAGMCFRKALDSAVKDLHPEANPRDNLAARIRNLPADKGITEPLRDWANVVRDLGNDAAHEDDGFTEKQAKDIHNFTRMFLTYTYSMRKEVDRLRAGDAGVSSAAPPSPAPSSPPAPAAP